MANPQPENGHTNIPNEVLEALWKVNLSAYETRVLFFLFRKIYGWHKKTDKISLSQFSKAIGIDRRLVHRTLKKLSSKQMIVIYRDDSLELTYGFQKDFEQWQLSSIEMTVKETGVICRDDKLSSIEMTKLSSVEMTTKETIKETTKETIYMRFLEFWNAYPKKRGKGYAERIWKKLKPDKDLHELILKKLAEAKKSHDWRKENGAYIPYPATWLNGKGWEDEYRQEKSYVQQELEKMRAEKNG